MFFKKAKLNKKTVNILLFSDFHNTVNHDTLKQVILSNPTPNIIFTLGDISVLDLSVIKNAFPDTQIYGVCGNHDDVSALDTVDIPNIHEKSIICCNVIFSGIGGSVKYKKGPYAMLSQNESISIANSLLPADVLISHDRAFTGKIKNNFPDFAEDPHEGMAGIAYYNRKNSPTLHVHGHIHTNKRYKFKGIDTISVYGITSISITDNKITDYQVLLDLQKTVSN